MENLKVLIDGIQKDVYGIFYIYDSKYYFIYTEKEVDENGYVILYMTQIGRETMNTENGPVDTGYMIGVEIASPEEQQKVQTSISYIVEDKKNNTTNPQIQYLPMNLISNLKIISKKRFRLMKSIIVNNFKLQIDEQSSQEMPSIAELALNVMPQPIIPDVGTQTIDASQPLSLENNGLVSQPLNSINNLSSEAQPQVNSVSNETTATNVVSEPQQNVIIDYRSKYFEEEEKNKELQEKINELTKKLEDIKKVLE